MKYVQCKSCGKTIVKFKNNEYCGNQRQKGSCSYTRKLWIGRKNKVLPSECGLCGVEIKQSSNGLRKCCKDCAYVRMLIASRELKKKRKLSN